MQLVSPRDDWKAVPIRKFLLSSSWEVPRQPDHLKRRYAGIPPPSLLDVGAWCSEGGWEVEPATEVEAEAEGAALRVQDRGARGGG